jgi:hypothetical protein
MVSYNGTMRKFRQCFYGTMVGPWCYQTATSVPRVRKLPFSLLRMLMLRRRLA